MTLLYRLPARYRLGAAAAMLICLSVGWSAHAEGVPSTSPQREARKKTAAKKAAAEDAMSAIRPKGMQGDATSQALLGAAYAAGDGVPQDFAEAAKWYRRAAEQGHLGAQYELGMSYYKGQGVRQDYAEAHKWFSVAAALAPRGDEQKKCASMRTAVAEQMSAEQVREAQKRANEWMAAFERRKK